MKPWEFLRIFSASMWTFSTRPSEVPPQVWWARIAGAPPVDRASQSGQLGHVGIGAVLQEHDQAATGVCDVDGGVDLAQQILGHDGGAEFAVGISGGEELEHPCQAIVAQAFVSGEEHAPAAVERITLAAAVAELFLLHPTAAVIDRRVRQLDRMEVVHHPDRVRQVRVECLAVAGGRIQGCERDLVAPVDTAFNEPGAQHVGGSALDDVEQAVAVQVDDLGREHRAMSGSGVQESFLIDADPSHALETRRVVDGGIGVSSGRARRAGFPRRSRT